MNNYQATRMDAPDWISRISASTVPALTTAQMREVDRLMIESLHISLTRMMENAGRNLAELARVMLGGRVEDKTIAVLVGRGNNGGGGMVAARHLANWGARVSANLTVTPPETKGVAQEQLDILRRMGIPILMADQSEDVLKQAELILDALIGYGLSDAPRGVTADWIRLANRSGSRILALDAPSGLDTTSGRIFDPCIQAQATLTLALPKTGLLAPDARAAVGELYVADIGVPRQVYAHIGIQAPNIFAEASLVRLMPE